MTAGRRPRRAPPTLMHACAPPTVRGVGRSLGWAWTLGTAVVTAGSVAVAVASRRNQDTGGGGRGRGSSDGAQLPSATDAQLPSATDAPAPGTVLARLPTVPNEDDQELDFVRTTKNHHSHCFTLPSL